MERRLVGVHEIRASKSGDNMTVKGYAARYNTLSHDLGGFRERIAPGAFKRILASNPDCVMTFNHDTSVVLGRTTSGTLRLREDSRGLAFECDLPNTQAGRETYELVRRGDLKDCSFAFNVAPEMYVLEEESVEDDSIRGAIKRTVKVIVRTIRDFANLFDCSIVTNPAYPGTSVDARHLVIVAELRSRIDAVRKPMQSLGARQVLERRNLFRKERQHREVVHRRRAVLDLL